MKVIFLFFVVIIMECLPAQGQTPSLKVHGKIINAISKEALPAVTIRFLQGKTTTTTDNEGRFSKYPFHFFISKTPVYIRVPAIRSSI